MRFKKQVVRKADNWIVVWPTELCPQLFRKSLKCVYTTHQAGERGGERDMRSEIPLDSDFMMLMINVLGMQ